MAIFPKIEKITRDATITHFFLMFGYKVFSLYFPLFLVARGMSLPEVGYAYFLIYLPIALFAPLVGFLNHKINPAVLTALGILGYGIYSLGMVTIKDPILFYSWQMLLGLSAALFFTSSRGILMGSSLEKPDRAFGWFYSAPFYAGAVAPAAGAFFIWQFDFAGVFIFSLAIHVLNSFFCFFRLRKPARVLPDHGFNFQNSKDNHRSVFRKIMKKPVFLLILASFSVLLLGGFYRAFFVLFLKQELAWSQNLILAFGALSSFLFLPVSLWIIKKLGTQASFKSVFQGALMAGIFTAFFGMAASFLKFITVLAIDLGRYAGQLLANSGRSGQVQKELKDFPEEAGAIDTVIAPLATALGSFLSGFLIGFLGFDLMFVAGGLLVAAFALFLKAVAKKQILT